MIKVFAPKTSPRLRYVLDFIATCTQVPIELIATSTDGSTGPNKILNYSKESNRTEYTILPSSLLFEQSIRSPEIKFSQFKGEPCFKFDGVTDPLATIFFILSRYEEYLPFDPDLHGRFAASQSWQHKFGILHKLVCDRLAFAIVSEALGEEALLVTDKSVKIIPTFDIDNTYAYLEKGRIRTFLSFLRDVWKNDLVRIKERNQVRKGKVRDPYDTFHIIEETAALGFEIRMFWLLGNYATYDKNLSWKNKTLRKLIRRCQQFAKIGIHPSYASNNRTHRVNEEVGRLSKLIDESIFASRQHFLKLSFPDTYKSLIKSNIQSDYTMGYADNVGFRAGTSRSFFWFDLKHNETTTFQVVPFAYMDGTLNEYLKLTPHDAKHVIRSLYEEISRFGGDLIFIWHNETLNNQGKWEGWKEVFNYSINLAQKDHE